MAGAGWKVFNAGAVLTAAEVNTYLMDQSVQVYAGTAARGSAIGTAVAEGMVSYLKDYNNLFLYDGAAWTSGIGKVMQIGTAVYSTQVDVSTNTYTDTGLTATITPTATTSKVLVIVQQAGVSKNGNTSANLRLLRGSTVLTYFDKIGGYDNASGPQVYGSSTTVWMDSPATTSATTYKTQLNSQNNLAAATVQTSSAESTMILMEISA